MSNGAICNDLERPLAQISRSRHYLTLNVSETVWERYTVTVDTNRDLHMLTEGRHFKWPWVTLSDFHLYSVTLSIARPLRDSWAFFRLSLLHLGQTLFSAIVVVVLAPSRITNECAIYYVTRKSSVDEIGERYEKVHITG